MNESDRQKPKLPLMYVLVSSLSVLLDLEAFTIQFTPLDVSLLWLRSGIGGGVIAFPLGATTVQHAQWGPCARHRI